MEPPNRKSSFDITEIRLSTRYPSPAPTYRSTPHSEKCSPFMDEKSRQMLEEKHTPFYPPQAEPFDKNHPHYAPPTHDIPSALPSNHRARGPRFPHFSVLTLLPWVLFTIFFLSTLWYTSIAFGIRLFASLHPSTTANLVPAPPPINIIINGDDHLVTPTMAMPNPTPTRQAPVPGNGVDPNLGTNTVSKLVKKGLPTARVGWVTVTRRGC